MFSQRQKKMDLRDERTRQKISHCQYHKGEVYTMFCITCDCLVCMSCILDNHYDQHKFCKISEIVDRKHREFCEILNTKANCSEVEFASSEGKLGSECEGHSIHAQDHCQMELNNVMAKQLDDMRSEEVEFSSLCDTMSEKINDRTDFLIENVNAERQRLLTKVKNAKSALLLSRKSKKDQLELCVSYLKIHETDLDFLNGLDDVFKVRIIEILRPIIEKNESMDTQVDISTLLTHTVQDETDVTGMIKTLTGDVTCSLEEAKYSGKQSQCAKEETNDDQEKQSSDSESDDVPKKTTIHTYDSCKVTKILPFDDNGLYLIYSMDTSYRCNVKPGLYITDSVTKYDPMLIRQNVVDICSGPMQYFYLSEKNSTVIMRYTRDGTLRRFVDCGIKSYARCLDFVSEEEQILAGIEKEEYTSEGKCYRYSVDIAIFNTTGQCLKAISCGCSDQDIRRYPRGITYWRSSPLLILVSMPMKPFYWGQRNGPGCLLNSVTSTPLFSGALGFKPAESFNPTGICLDGQGRIIVSDDVNHVVYLLNPDGKFRKILISGDEITSPSAIALDNRGYFFIACCDKIHVMKYQPD